MLISATAQAEARAILASPEANASVELDIARTVTQRIQFQEEKRQRNIISVVHQAAEELGDKDVPDEPTDHDWAARFFGDVQDVSSPEMQLLWAKVLAGEVERPGSTSIKTLSILRNLDRQTASLFRSLCSMCVSLKLGGNQFLDARVPSLGGDAAANALQGYGLSFDNLNALNEHGLVISDYNSRMNYKICVSNSLAEQSSQTALLPFTHQGNQWVLVPTEDSART